MRNEALIAIRNSRGPRVAGGRLVGLCSTRGFGPSRRESAECSGERNVPLSMSEMRKVYDQSAVFTRKWLSEHKA